MNPDARSISLAFQFHVRKFRSTECSYFLTITVQYLLDAEKPRTGQDEKRLGLRMKKQRRPDCIASHVLQPGTVRPSGADCTPGESDFRLRGRDGVWGLLSNQLVAVTSPARLRTTADRSRANITAGRTLFVSGLSSVGTLGRWKTEHQTQLSGPTVNDE